MSADPGNYWIAHYWNALSTAEMAMQLEAGGEACVPAEAA